VPERRGGSSNSQNNNVVTVSGDTLLDDLALFTIEKEIGDLSFCSGIPGTVGGGIAGNAGAFGRQTGDHLVSAEILGLDGAVRTVAPDELDFSYRHSTLKETGEIVLSAIFELPMLASRLLAQASDAGKTELLAERERIMTFRKENHPDWHTTPCAGSVFRNIEPTSAVEQRKSAGYFLEEAGAKTMQIGGAHIFEKHANMILGGEGCTAQNVWELSEQMKQAVQKKFDLELIREVRFLGDFQALENSI
jgi:UDP-N-acetylmuramate dehydrogenase